MDAVAKSELSKEYFQADYLERIELIEEVECRTKEAIQKEVDQLPVEMGLLSKETVKQAIDSVGG